MSSPWTHEWKIVRADLALAHVFAPEDEITFVKCDDGRYRVEHSGTAATYLDAARLQEVAGSQPAFDVISRDYPLPLFSKHHKRRYRSLTDKIEAFVQGNPALLRLEGEIRIPCHAFAYQAQESDAADYHAAIEKPTPIRVYVFENAVEGNKRLLVIYQPLHRLCVTNGNGTVIGYD